MRYLSVAAILLVATLCWAMSVEEIGRLTDLKTKDDLLIQMIEKDGLDKPLATEDVIFLREHGASERVIQYCMKLSESKKVTPVPKVQEDSEMLTENLRAYTTTTSSGKKVRVVTNLDENGQRMGGPVPAAPPEPEPAPPAPPPQEIKVTVTQEPPPPPDYEEEYVPSYDQPMVGPSYYPQYDPYYPFGGYGGYPVVMPPYYPGHGHGQNPPTWHESMPPVRTQGPRPKPPLRPAAPAAQGVRPHR